MANAPTAPSRSAVRPSLDGVFRPAGGGHAQIAGHPHDRLGSSHWTSKPVALRPGAHHRDSSQTRRRAAEPQPGWFPHRIRAPQHANRPSSSPALRSRECLVYAVLSSGMGSTGFEPVASRV